jgi:hypothetical protein
VIAFVLGAFGRFLPHDERYLGMTAGDLCALHGCRIVHFMIHDRISFGGALVAVGLLYGWLTVGPLKGGRAWAWWALVCSGIVGFASFFAYLGYGYLDTWHGLATLALLPCFAFGLAGARGNVMQGAEAPGWMHSASWSPWLSVAGVGRAALLTTALGMIFGGLTIFVVGTTCVFVPQDLAFMDLSVEELQSLNQRLVPLIAHDRAGFGGAVCCAGIALFFCVWYAPPSRGLWWTLLLAGIAGFGAGIGAHPAVGYNDAIHLAPALIGACGFAIGMGLSIRQANMRFAPDG